MEIYSVTEALYYLKVMLECDDRLSDLWLQGEVSGSSRPSSGHIFFTLKDGSGQIPCVLFRTAALRQTHLPRDGSSFVMHGHLDVYEATGKLQFYVDLVQPDGLGRLHLEFEALKQRLEEEGLFAPERKRLLPERPKVIGVVTSPTAAAFQDILNVLRRRYPLAQVVLSPTQVQGETAPSQIVAAIQALNRRPEVDVIIVARGGGSLEDLWAFNDERVARAVFASRIPVVTGVGHETDFTIVDFVSDLRAPTPSAAAELVAPNIEELREEVTNLADRLYVSMQNQLDEYRAQLDETKRRFNRASPAARIASFRLRLHDLGERRNLHLRHLIKLRRAELNGELNRLKVLNPQQILERGYAVVTREANDAVVSSVVGLQNGTDLRIRVKDGTFGAKAL